MGIIIPSLICIFKRRGKKMNIKQIQCFVAVADTKSFSEAARLMYISVSQISKMVKGLEDELGHELFERKKSGIILTREGMKIYSIANKVLRDFDEFELVRERSGRESLIVLGLPDVYMDNVFTDYIKLQTENDYFYNLSNVPIDNMCQALHVRKADMGFAYIEKRRKTAIQMRLADFALEFTPITKTKKFMFVNSKHKLASAKHVSLSDVEKADQIKINGTDFLEAEHIKSTYGNMFTKPVMRMLTLSLPTAVNMVKNTDMVYIGCDVFDCVPGREDIKRVELAEMQEDIDFGYIKRHNIEMSSIAKEFTDFVTSKIPQ